MSVKLPRKVRVVMFDRLPFDPSGTGHAPAELTHEALNLDSMPTASATSGNGAKSSPLNDLDLHCAYFEQYLLQDARSNATVRSVLGGDEAVPEFLRLLHERGHSVSCIQVATALAERTERSGSFSDAAQLDPVQLIVSADGHVTALAEQLKSALTSDLVWMDVVTGDPGHAAETVNRMLAWLFSDCVGAGNPDDRPVTLITVLRGNDWPVRAPLKSGISEPSIQVPLWIDCGSNDSSVAQARRLQALAGSFDLLPTILELITGESPAAVTKTGAVAASHPLSTGPISLWPAFSQFLTMPDRILPLQGDHWSAWRTQNFLLVQPTAQEPAAPVIGASVSVSTESADEDESWDGHADVPAQLYLKPDDYWNVNNVIVSYEAVAEQILAACPKS
jgi:hypothetical protein